jgi:hypothetical protein
MPNLCLSGSYNCFWAIRLKSQIFWGFIRIRFNCIRLLAWFRQMENEYPPTTNPILYSLYSAFHRKTRGKPIFGHAARRANLPLIAPFPPRIFRLKTPKNAPKPSQSPPILRGTIKPSQIPGPPKSSLPCTKRLKTAWNLHEIVFSCSLLPALFSLARIVPD